MLCAAHLLGSAATFTRHWPMREQGWKSHASPTTSAVEDARRCTAQPALHNQHVKMVNCRKPVGRWMRGKGARMVARSFDQSDGKSQSWLRCKGDLSVMYVMMQWWRQRKRQRLCGCCDECDGSVMVKAGEWAGNHPMLVFCKFHQRAPLLSFAAAFGRGQVPHVGKPWLGGVNTRSGVRLPPVPTD